MKEIEEFPWQPLKAAQDTLEQASGSKSFRFEVSISPEGKIEIGPRDGFSLRDQKGKFLVFVANNLDNAVRHFMDFFQSNEALIEKDEDGFQYEARLAYRNGEWEATAKTGDYYYTDSFDD